MAKGFGSRGMGGMGGGMNMNMIKQAQKMQQDMMRMQQELEEKTYEASAGGGGRGMRRVDHPADLERLFHEARAESVACFGSGELYLEKLILDPRHIEFQIMADRQGHVVHLGERDCSLQRRNQKLSLIHI